MRVVCAIWGNCYYYLQGQVPTWSMFTGTSLDKRGVARGECRDCPDDCSEYSQPLHRNACDYCECPAGRHVRVEAKPDQLIKIEPGMEEDEEEDTHTRQTSSQSSGINTRQAGGSGGGRTSEGSGRGGEGSQSGEGTGSGRRSLTENMIQPRQESFVTPTPNYEVSIKRVTPFKSHLWWSLCDCCLKTTRCVCCKPWLGIRLSGQLTLFITTWKMFGLNTFPDTTCLMP